MADVSVSAGDLKASYDTSNLTLTKAAPGTFFCVLGACIVIANIVKGLKFDYEDIGKNFRFRSEANLHFNSSPSSNFLLYLPPAVPYSYHI